MTNLCPASDLPGFLDGWEGPVDLCGRLDFSRAEVRDRGVRRGKKLDKRFRPVQSGDYWEVGFWNHGAFDVVSSERYASLTLAEMACDIERDRYWDNLREQPAALLAECRAVAK